MRYFKKVEGEKVYLSPLNLDDAEKYVEWLSDKEVARNLTLAHILLNTESEREALQRLAADNMAIVLRDGDTLIGSCGFVEKNDIQRFAEVGIMIGDKRYQGQGYGTEAMRLLLDFAFNVHNLHSVRLRVKSFNIRAVKSYEKCGFKLAGRFREAGRIDGICYDELLMDILEEEYRELQRQREQRLQELLTRQL